MSSHRCSLVVFALVAALSALAQSSQAATYYWKMGTLSNGDGVSGAFSNSWDWTTLNTGTVNGFWTLTPGGSAASAYPGQGGSTTDQVILAAGNSTKQMRFRNVDCTVNSIEITSSQANTTRWEFYGLTNSSGAVENDTYALTVNNQFKCSQNLTGGNGTDTKVVLNLTGTGSVVVDNVGKLLLNHANTYTGTTTVASVPAGITSTLTLNADGALGSGAVAIGSAPGGGAGTMLWSVTQTNAGYTNNPLSSLYNHAAPTITINATGSLDIRPVATLSDLDVTLNGGKIFNGGTAVTAWTYGGDVTVNTTGTLGATQTAGTAASVATFTGDLLGGGALTVDAKNGTFNNVVELNHGNASFMGDWLITSGILRASQNSALGTAAVDVTIASGAFLDLNFTGASVTVASLTINGVGYGPGTYTSSDASGALTGGGSITVAPVTVPEPATMALLALGGLGMAGLRARRRGR